MNINDEIVAAYHAGTYDGYWGCHLFEGAHDNRVWLAYLRGWLAGHNDRINGPTDEECRQFAEEVAALIKGSDR